MNNVDDDVDDDDALGEADAALLSRLILLPVC